MSGELSSADESGEKFIAKNPAPLQAEGVERLPYNDEEAIRRAQVADREMIERISQPPEHPSDKA